MPRKSRTKRRKQHCKWQHTTRGCDTNKWQLTAVKQVAFLTVNHRGPLPLRELHSTGETIVWRDPGGSWACLQPVYDWEWSHSATGCDTDRQVAYIFVKQVVFLTVNHRGPLPLRELHSTGEKLVWRDPGGSWACLQPVYEYEWNPPATVCDTCCDICPERHTEKKGAPPPPPNTKKCKSTNNHSCVQEGLRKKKKKKRKRKKKSLQNATKY